jgi:hypothetical protein
MLNQPTLKVYYAEVAKLRRPCFGRHGLFQDLFITKCIDEDTGKVKV